MTLETKNRTFRLDQETLIPVGIVASVFVIVVGAVVWLTTLSNATSSNTQSLAAQEQEIRELRQSQDKWNSVLVDVQIRLEKIGGQLDILTHQKRSE